MLIDFNFVFTRFHFLSFANDLWMLDPRTDNLIIMFPQRFFFEATLMIAVMTAIEFAGLVVGAKLLSNRYGGSTLDEFPFYVDGRESQTRVTGPMQLQRDPRRPSLASCRHRRSIPRCHSRLHPCQQQGPTRQTGRSPKRRIPTVSELTAHHMKGSRPSRLTCPWDGEARTHESIRRSGIRRVA